MGNDMEFQDLLQEHGSCKAQLQEHKGMLDRHHNDINDLYTKLNANSVEIGALTVQLRWLTKGLWALVTVMSGALITYFFTSVSNHIFIK